VKQKVSGVARKKIIAAKKMFRSLFSPNEPIAQHAIKFTTVTANRFMTPKKDKRTTHRVFGGISSEILWYIIGRQGGKFGCGGPPTSVPCID
jgi:hypothetical protein